MALIRSLKKICIDIIAALFPVGILLIAYALTGIYPFGPKTLLTIDMSNEYVDYFSYFKSLFTGGGSVFYSFQKTLGGNMMGLFAYYLASPLNLLFLLFRRENFDTAITLLTLIKTGLCGLTFSVYLRRVFKAPSLATVLFSVFYALAAYNIVYALNIMWLDGVFLLPLVALGIERIVDKRGPALYCAALALSILTNFYIGYMICLFSALFFLYRLLLSDGFHKNGARYALRISGRFALSSVLAAGLSSPLLFPALISLSTSKEKLPTARYTGGMAAAFNFSPLDFLRKFALGAYSANDAANGLPNVYCGLLVVLLIFLFFASARISLREKLYSAGFLAILTFSFLFSPLNLVWHGFNPPTWFPYRYSFVLCFLLIVLAFRAFLLLGHEKAGRVQACCIIVPAGFAAMLFQKGPDILKQSLSVVFTGVYSLLLVGWTRGWKRVKQVFPVLLTLAVCSEFAIGSYELMRGFSYGKRADYRSFIKSTGPAADWLTAKDGGFYRVEKTYTRLNSHGSPTFNDSMMFGYNGLSHYSSTDDKAVNTLMGKLGYHNNGNWTWYCRGSAAAADSILGVKYLLCGENQTMNQPYIKVGEADGIDIYRNPYALPVGFMVSGAVRNADMSGMNPFEFLNRTLSSMTSGGDCLFPVGGFSAELQNCAAVKNGDRTLYIRVDKARPARVLFHLKASSNYPCYAFFEAFSQRGADLTINGKELGTFFDTYDNGVLPLGSFRNGEEITLTLSLRGDTLKLGGGTFDYLDTDKFSRITADLSAGGISLDSQSSVCLKGSVRSAGNGQILFTSIPYDTGWKVTVDGGQAATFRILGALTGVAVPAGVHKVEFTYLPPGLLPGCAVFAVSLIGLCLYRFLRHRQRTVNPFQ